MIRPIRFSRRALTIALAAAFATYSLTLPAGAADFRAGGQVTIPAGDTLRDDLYIFGGKLQMDGVVLGDVIACGGNVNVRGAVTGSLFTCGGATQVAGSVGRTLRSGGGNVEISGTIGGDAVVGSGRLMLARGAHVGRDLLAGGGELDLDGDVERNATVGGGDVTFAGRVGGGVRARTGRTRLLDGARIGGDFIYKSDRSVVRAPGAMVAGKIEQRIPRGHNNFGVVGQWARFMYGWERSLAGLLAVGLLFVLPFPRFARRVLDALGGSPGASLLAGIVLLIGVPFVAITLGMIGLVLGGWWLGMCALVLFALSLALGTAMTGAFLGQRILQRPKEAGLVWGLVAGVAILTLAARVPLLGIFVACIAAIFGLGALAIAARRASTASTATA